MALSTVFFKKGKKKAKKRPEGVSLGPVVGGGWLYF